MIRYLSSRRTTGADGVPEMDDRDVHRFAVLGGLGHDISVRKVLIAVLFLAGLGFAAWWFLQPREGPDVAFFRDELPRWWIARTQGGPEVESLLQTAGEWPATKASLRELDGAFPDGDAVKAKSQALNDAIWRDGLPYWIDVHVRGGLPIVLVYRLERRTEWRSGDKTVEVLRVHRLDRTNVVTEFLGHAGGGRPAVLLDRIELEVSDYLRRLGDEGGSAADRVALEAWQRNMESAVGPSAFAALREKVLVRERAFDSLEARLKRGTVQVLKPARFIYGDRFFEQLEPLADRQRRGGPLLLRADIAGLRDADRALSGGPEHEAMIKIRDIEADATEAHEVRHILSPAGSPEDIPGPLIDFVGAEDLAFSASSDGELRAYLGQLHDAVSPPCLTIGRLARSAAGAQRRLTPHHYAARTIFAAADSKADVAAAATALCERPAADVRRFAADTWQSLYGEPFQPAAPIAK